MDRVLVTPRALTLAPHPALERLKDAGCEVIYCAAGKQPDERELLQLVPPCSGWLAGVEPVSEAVVRAASELRVISRNGVGTENLPMQVLAERGVRVLKAEGANSVGVAELTVGLIFASLRHIPYHYSGIREGHWPRRKGIEIRGRRLGIVGCGAIGREVARLAHALGANVIAFDPQQPALGLPSEAVTWSDLDDLLRTAEIITLHCPPRSDGQPLIGKPELNRMKDGSVLVNTARATLIDEQAVLDSLDTGRLATYATDVFEQEPPSRLTLAQHERVIATSHIGGFTEESVDRATELAVTNLLQVLRPRPERRAI